MKIVVFGGSGLIGRGLVPRLRNLGHEVTSASPSTGVNTLTGTGLDAILKGVSVTIDVTNSPSFEDTAVRDFFRTSTANILQAASSAGVQHHLALSVVAAEKLPDSGYMRAKVLQESLIASSDVPYTILRATQFFEFVEAIADFSTDTRDQNTVRLSPAKFQPLAADDISAELARLAVAAPSMGSSDLAGPEVLGLDEAVRIWSEASGDGRKIVTDARALYYGADVSAGLLLPGEGFSTGSTTFAQWLEKKKNIE